MGRFAKIEKVSPTERGVPFPIGDFRVRVLKNKCTDSQDKQKQYFISEFLILESSNPELSEGDKRSHVIWLNNPKAYDAPWSDVKAYICACLGLRGEDHEAITEELVEFVVENNDDMPGGPFEGLELSLTVSTRQKKGGDGDLSPHVYHDADEEMAEQLRNHCIEMGLLATG